jgi:hypothetical protein
MTKDENYVPIYNRFKAGEEAKATVASDGKAAIVKPPSPIKRVTRGKRKKEMAAPIPVLSAPTDVFSLQSYGEEEFGPTPVDSKGKPIRKKVNRRPKKQPLEMALEFQQKQRQAAPVLKEIKNIKVPATKPINKKPRVMPMLQNVLPSESPVRSKGLPFLPPPIVVTQINDQDSMISDVDFYNPPAQDTSLAPLRGYKTPNIPRHIIHVEGKVSTPKLEEIGHLSKAELKKICFGFSDDDAANQSAYADNDASLFGISPVRAATRDADSESILSSHSLISNASQMSAFHTSHSLKRPHCIPRKEEDPWRFDQNAFVSGLKVTAKLAYNAAMKASMDTTSRANQTASKPATNTTVKTLAKSAGTKMALKTAVKGSTSDTSKIAPKRTKNATLKTADEKSSPRKRTTSTATVRSSPQKRVHEEKANPEADEWATERSSHFSEVNEFDLTFS